MGEQLCLKSIDFHRFFLWIIRRLSDARFEDSIDDAQQFSGDQCNLGRFTGGFEPLVERADGKIVSHGAQRRPAPGFVWWTMAHRAESTWIFSLFLLPTICRQRN